MIQTGYHYSETQQLIIDAAKDFAQQHIAPFVSQWDENQEFPIELMKMAGQQGFMGILVPQKYGGAELGYHEYIAIVEELSKVDPSIGLSVAAHNSLCTNHILSFGTEAQKNKWLPQLAAGAFIGAWGLT